MFIYSLKRIIWVIPVVIGVLLLVFFFQSLTGDDIVFRLLGENSTAEARAALREQMGLDDPMLVQMGRYIWGFITRGDLGTSYVTKQPITTELMLRFPVTLQLTFLSISLGICVGVPLGIIATLRQYSLADSAILTFAVLTASMPGFWLGLMMISFFAVSLGWLPAAGILTWKGWIMPTVAVSVTSMSNIIRVTRTSMLEVIRQDFIRTAKAKGQKLSVITIRHAFRNSLIPIIATIGNSLGLQLGGALAIESVFSVPGIGKYAVDAISFRNFPAVSGSVVLLAIVFIIVNLVIDLLYTVADPRLKTAFTKGRMIKRKRDKVTDISNGGIGDG